jgi:hypothetical protein
MSAAAEVRVPVQLRDAPSVPFASSAVSRESRTNAPLAGDLTANEFP